MLIIRSNDREISQLIAREDREIVNPLNSPHFQGNIFICEYGMRMILGNSRNHDDDDDENVTLAKQWLCTCVVNLFDLLHSAADHLTRDPFLEAPGNYQAR